MPHPPLYKEGWGYSKRGVKGNSMADQKKLNQYSTANFKTRFNEGDAGTGTSPAALYPPLRGHRVVMFPDTDPDGIAFRCWNNAAREVMRSVFWEDSPPIRVSPLLELKATAAQKHRKIDILDFLFEQQ